MSFGRPEMQADLADFVLEQFAQWFHQLQMHALRQTTNVVVGLDHMGFAEFRCRRFDHVRIDRALSEPGDILDAVRFAIEDIDEGVADDLALGFRVC